jgi:hypothetical protein
MKLEGRLFVYACVFYWLIGIIYAFWAREPTGIALFFFLGALGFLPAVFMLHTARKVYPRPEDDPDADITDADTDYGFYSPHSWWPMPLAASAALISFGFAVAAWIVVVGVVALFLSLVGFMFEYYRGDHAH